MSWLSKAIGPAHAAATHGDPAMKRSPIALPLLVALAALAPATRAGAPLPVVVASAGSVGAETGFEGVVESERQVAVAAQVPGAVVYVGVRAGERVRAGQVLLRIDARASGQNASAVQAQVAAARAALDEASRDLERQRHLAARHFVSQAALDQSEARFRSAQAQLAAHSSLAQAARTQDSFHVLRAPFAGVVSDVPVSLGDMAMPGRPLVLLHDPGALRVTAAVPQGFALRWKSTRLPRVEIPGHAGDLATLRAVAVQVLPVADPTTHTVQLRAELPPGLAGAAPGMFARVWLSSSTDAEASGTASPRVPRSAVVRRSEMTGLYVLDPQGRPALRQVRLGRSDGAVVEVLAGLSTGERVVTDPAAAARTH